eukprot:213015_1
MEMQQWNPDSHYFDGYLETDDPYSINELLIESRINVKKLEKQVHKIRNDINNSCKNKQQNTNDLYELKINYTEMTDTLDRERSKVNQLLKILDKNDFIKIPEIVSVPPVSRFFQTGFISPQINIINKVLPIESDASKKVTNICRKCWNVNQIIHCNGIRKYCHHPICKSCNIKERGDRIYECFPCKKEKQLFKQPFINAISESTNNLLDIDSIHIIIQFICLAEYYYCFECEKNTITVCNDDYKNAIDLNGNTIVYYEASADTNYNYLKLLCRSCRSVNNNEYMYPMYVNYNAFQRKNDKKNKKQKQIDYRYHYKKSKNKNTL